MAKFENIIPWLLYQEDSKKTPGLIKDLNDGAGSTRLGITQVNFASLMPPDYFSSMGFSDAVKAAKKLYRDRFWHYINGDGIDSEEIAAYLLSFAVNRNPSTANKALQRVLGVLQDGVIGPNTLAELNSKDSAAVAKLFRAEWITFYRHLADINPSKTEFLDGWINRANFPYPSPLVPSIYE